MKSRLQYSGIVHVGRPRKGAWIEIALACSVSRNTARRPRKGAWIEISRTGTPLKTT